MKLESALAIEGCGVSAVAAVLLSPSSSEVTHALKRGARNHTVAQAIPRRVTLRMDARARLGRARQWQRAGPGRNSTRAPAWHAHASGQAPLCPGPGPEGAITGRSPRPFCRRVVRLATPPCYAGDACPPPPGQHNSHGHTLTARVLLMPRHKQCPATRHAHVSGCHGTGSNCAVTPHRAPTLRCVAARTAVPRSFMPAVRMPH